MSWSALRFLLTARCRDTTRIASDECDGPVSRTDRWAARLHRVACRPCRQCCRQIRLVDRLLKRAPEEARDAVADGERRLAPEAAARIGAAFAAARRSDDLEKYL